MDRTELFFVDLKKKISELNSSILCIGGFNQDIQSTPTLRAVSGDSVPGSINISAGGVARNIAENASRLGLNCSFFGLYGNDAAGTEILRETSLAGVNVDHCKCVMGEKSSIYSAFLDEKGEMLYAVNDMSLMEKMTPSLLKEHKNILEQSDYLVLDANLPEESLSYLTKCYSQKILLIDPVSAAKIVKLKNNLHSVSMIKPNTIEAEIFTNRTVSNDDDYYMAIEGFLSEGVERVYLSAGSRGIYYGEKNFNRKMRAVPVQINSVTGAGDAASAALLLSFLLGLDMLESAFLANLAAASSLLCSHSINRDLSLALMQNLCKEYQYDSVLS